MFDQKSGKVESPFVGASATVVSKAKFPVVEDTEKTLKVIDEALRSKAQEQRFPDYLQQPRQEYYNYEFSLCGDVIERKFECTICFGRDPECPQKLIARSRRGF